MKTKIHKLVRLLGSGWVFTATVVLFVAETGWLAVTSRFPMAFDEAYHFGLIQFFSHRLDPIVTRQPAETYRFGAIIQNPSFLYHYLMSFPDRLISLVTVNPMAHVVCLRFVNIALAVATLVITRKLLRLLKVSDALSNLLVLAFALTPIVTVVAAQINYDNLFVLAVSMVVYVAISFMRQLQEENFDMGKLLSLLCLCLFASLVKFAFLPILAVIVAVVGWKIITVSRRKDNPISLKKAAKSFAGLNRFARAMLIAAIIVGGFLFMRIYAVNLIKYHNPVPQCDLILTYADCEHYYAWNNSHTIPGREQSHPATLITIPTYGSYWLLVNTADLFTTLVPIYGNLYISFPYAMIVVLLGSLMFICAILNFRKMVRERPEFVLLAAIVVIYIAVLWARNYHDYLLTGKPIAIHGRYLLPVLMYIYILLAFGFQTAFSRVRQAPMIKVGTALIVACAFICFGGFRQYVSHIDPVYGRLNTSNDFRLHDTAPTYVPSEHLDINHRE